MKTYRCIKATIVTATIAAIKHMYELHDKSEYELVVATRYKAKPERLKKLWAEHDLLERAIVRAEATLPQRVVERVKSGEL